MKMVNYSFEGKRITKDEALAKPVMAVGLLEHDTSAAIAFDNREQLLSYLSGRKDAETISKAFAQVDAVYKLKDRDNSKFQARQVGTVKRIAAELEVLAQDEGLHVNSQKLFERATSKADPIAGPIFDPCQLFEHPNCTGRRLDVPAWTGFPDLRWHNFDNITSSIRVGAWSVALLFDRYYYDILPRPEWGRVVSFWAPLWWSIDYNIDDYMNDKASSVFTT
ncbi:MAG: hypothetical protein ACKV22_07665 [Bryobacteraceae bacterium]